VHRDSKNMLFITKLRVLFIDPNHGQGAVEYALIVMLIACGVITVFHNLANTIEAAIAGITTLVFSF